MSRSYRKNPFGGNCGAHSEKWDKRKANRTLRHVNKDKLRHGEKENFTIMREASDVWGFGKDGKAHFPEPTKPDSHTYWVMRWYGITEEEAMERERKSWNKFMRK